MYKCLKYIILFFSISPAFSQLSIKGKIIDKTTNEPLELANIKNFSTRKNILTSKEGDFMLKDIKASDSIVVSFVGYTSQQVIIGTDANKLLLVQLEKG